MWRDKVKRILRWGWRAIQVWSILVALGVASMLGGFLRGVVAEWSWYDQLLLFGGIFLLVLGVLALLSPLIRQWVAPINSIPQKKLILQPETKTHLAKNKLLFVIRHIAEQRQITPQGSDITVHLPMTFLNIVNIEDLNNILLKLQNDDKILTIKYFPKYLLPRFPHEFTEEMLSEQVLDSLDPNRRQFRVETNEKRFDDFVRQLGIYQSD